MGNGKVVSGKHYFGVPARPRREQAICDSIQAEFRASQADGDKKSTRLEGAPRSTPQWRRPTTSFGCAWPKSWNMLGEMLDAMGDELSGDMGVVMRHGVALQSVDIVGQMLGHIAAVTRSSAPDRAVERIGMCELKARLTRRGTV